MAEAEEDRSPDSASVNIATVFQNYNTRLQSDKTACPARVPLCQIFCLASRFIARAPQTKKENQQ